MECNDRCNFRNFTHWDIKHTTDMKIDVKVVSFWSTIDTQNSENVDC